MSIYKRTFGNLSLYRVFIMTISLSRTGDRLGLLQNYMKNYKQHSRLAFASKAWHLNCDWKKKNDTEAAYLRLRERGRCNGDRRPSSSRLRDVPVGYWPPGKFEPGKPGCVEHGVPGFEKWQDNMRNSSLVGILGS